MAFYSWNFAHTSGKSKLFVAVQGLLFVLYFILPELYRFRFHAAIVVLGWLLAATGFFIVLWAAFNLGRNISPFPSPLPQAELVTKGLFRHIRHPIYTGLILLFTGMAVGQESLTKLLFVGVFILFFSIKSAFEEQRLIEKFPEYKTYKDRTGRFLPNFRSMLQTRR